MVVDGSADVARGRAALFHGESRALNDASPRLIPNHMQVLPITEELTFLREVDGRHSGMRKTAIMDGQALDSLLLNG
jgi:hypothetical protein